MGHLLACLPLDLGDAGSHSMGKAESRPFLFCKKPEALIWPLLLSGTDIPPPF